MFSYYFHSISFTSNFSKVWNAPFGLKSFIKNIETVERRIASDKEKLSFHYKKWEKLLPFLQNSPMARVNGVYWGNFKLLMVVIQIIKSGCCSEFAMP